MAIDARKRCLLIEDDPDLGRLICLMSKNHSLERGHFDPDKNHRWGASPEKEG